MNVIEQLHHIQALTLAARLLIQAIEQGRDPSREVWKLKRVIRQGRVKSRRGVELSELVAALEAAERIEQV